MLGEGGLGAAAAAPIETDGIETTLGIAGKALGGTLNPQFSGADSRRAKTPDEVRIL